MDEKVLKEMELGGSCLVPRKGIGGVTSHEHSGRICDCERRELVRLARLGLWTEKHMKQIRSSLESSAMFMERICARRDATNEFRDALASLPTPVQPASNVPGETL